jgi:hypothetical protein
MHLKGYNRTKEVSFRLPGKEEGEWEGQYTWGIFFFFYYSYVHTRLGSFLPPAPTPSLTTHSTPSLCAPPPIPSRNYFTLISDFVVERV